MKEKQIPRRILQYICGLICMAIGLVLLKRTVWGVGVDPAAVKVTAIGHAHIDVEWLWPLRETVRKVGRTWASQIGLIARYPGYKFGASQAQLYKFCKDFLAKEKVDYFIFGHYHCRVDMAVEGARLLLMKDWMDGRSWISYDSESGQIAVENKKK